MLSELFFTSPKPSFYFYLTPAPLLLERGYYAVSLCITLLLLKEKELEDEVAKIAVVPFRTFLILVI